MLQIPASGAPYQIGLQHGQEARSQVRGTMEFYAGLFKVNARMDWRHVQELALRIWLDLCRLHVDVDLLRRFQLLLVALTVGSPADVLQNLWHYLVTYYIGALTNSPVTLAHDMGVFRGFVGAGEAIGFGIDPLKIPFIDEAGGIFAFFLAGTTASYHLGWFHIDDSNYFTDGEDGAIVPNHILQEKGIEGQPEEAFGAGSMQGVDHGTAIKA